MNKKNIIIAFIVLIMMQGVNADILDRYSLTNSEGLKIPLFDKETGLRWATISVDSFYEKAKRVGPFKLRAFPVLVVKDLKLSIKSEGLRKDSLTKVNNKLGMLLDGSSRIKFEGVCIEIISDDGIMKLKASTFDKPKGGLTDRLFLKGNVVVEEGGKVIKTVNQLSLSFDKNKVQIHLP